MSVESYLNKQYYCLTKTSDYGDGYDDKEIYVPINNVSFKETYNLDKVNLGKNLIDGYYDRIVHTRSIYDWKYHGIETLTNDKIENMFCSVNDKYIDFISEHSMNVQFSIIIKKDIDLDEL